MPPLRRAVSQAAFFLTEHTRPTLSEREQVVIDLTRRLLARGDRPPVDGLIEDWVLDASGLSSAVVSRADPGDLARDMAPRARVPAPDDIAAAVCLRDTFEPDPEASTRTQQAVVESAAERAVYRALTNGPLDERAGHWIAPQAALGLITAATTADVRRVDFLIAHPLALPCVIEVDGVQHRAGVEVDRDRDRVLAAAGIRAHRVSSTAVPDAAVSRVRSHLPSTPSPSDGAATLVWAPVVAARIARALVEAVAAGWLRGQTWSLQVEEPIGVGPVAVRSALELLASVDDVWSAGLAPDHVTVHADGHRVALHRDGVSYGEVTGVVDDAAVVDARLVVEPFRGPWHRLPDNAGLPTVLVRSALLPIDIRDPRTFGAFLRRVPNIDNVSQAALVRLLQGVFGKREFYPADGPHPRGQEVAIRRILDGRDAAVLLPTGAGKSLIYQMAGLLLPGATVVVDPIVALIDDQLEGLESQGIDRAIGITGADTRAGRTEAKLASIRSGDAVFCFVAPQRLQSRAFREALRELAVSKPMSIAVVDEAHCVSEWGHTFMAAYLGLAHALREIGKDALGVGPPVLALTGTASRSVLRDMLVELEIDRSDPGVIIIPVDFDRPELSYGIVHSGDDELVARLIGTLRSIPSYFGEGVAAFFSPDGPQTRSGLVFVQTVNPSPTYPDLGILNLQRALESAFNVPVGVYAGSAPKAFTGNWDDRRREQARAFKKNEIPILVATKAFGMGIDKPNIRYTVHVGIPGSIEAFYQEAGRAGRDRQASRCVIVHDPAASGFWEWAHRGSFQGVDADLAAIARALARIGELGARRRVQIPLSSTDSEGDTDERAIHRLRLLGVVTDYTVDWGAKRLELLLAHLTPELLDAALLTYIRRTQPGRVAGFEKVLAGEPTTDTGNHVLRNARHLLGFIYDTVANARIQALLGMQELADNAHGDDEIRDRILRYLELGKVAGELEALIDQEPFAFEGWRELYFRLDTVEDGREWRGATTRFLESSPDHPGLLVGRALAESAVPEGDVRLFSSSLMAGIESAIGRYNVEAEEVAEFIEWVVGWLHERKPAWSGLAMLVWERAPDLAGIRSQDGLERRLIRDVKIADPHELAMAYSRIQDRYVRSLWEAAQNAQEMLSR